MTTYLSELVDVIQERWREVDLLTYQLVEFEGESVDSSYYSSISRSITVLIVAHLEGFIKDLAKAVVRDLNTNCEFQDLSPVIQKTYCRKYFGSEDNITNFHHYSKQLVEKFCETGCEISYEPYIFIDNKNPKPDQGEIVNVF